MVHERAPGVGIADLRRQTTPSHSLNSEKAGRVTFWRVLVHCSEFKLQLDPGPWQDTHTPGSRITHMTGAYLNWIAYQQFGASSDYQRRKRDQSDEVNCPYICAVMSQIDSYSVGASHDHYRVVAVKVQQTSCKEPPGRDRPSWEFL